MTDLQVIDQRPQAALEAYTNEWVDVVRDTVARGATDAELKLFLYQCRKTGLDPLARQVYFRKQASKNGPVVSVQTSIDGFRLTAQRTGEYAGSDDAVFDNEEKPNKATVVVYRIVKGVRCGFTGTARWSEYCPPPGQDFMWKKMPCTMLSKCAEALALRKAFPQELSGVYTTDEMAQAKNQEVEAGEAVEGEEVDSIPIPFGADSTGSSATTQSRTAPSHGKATAEPYYIGTEEQKTLIREAMKKQGHRTRGKDAGRLLKGAHDACYEKKVPLRLIDAAVREYLDEQENAEAAAAGGGK